MSVAMGLGKPIDCAGRTIVRDSEAVKKRQGYCRFLRRFLGASPVLQFGNIQLVNEVGK
jgi:hypothetical protein